MTEIKIKVIEQKEGFVSIKTPWFGTDGTHFFAVFSDKECIQVTNATFIQKRIEQVDSSLPFRLRGMIKITKEQFTEQYNEVLNYFSKQLTQ